MSTFSEPWLEGQVVLILCGLVASGKSTFAEQLQHHFPKFRRCNQDDLGDRRQVERLARDSLASGLSACIDRTNFNATQRSYWIEIAREFPGTSIWVIVFDTPYEVCAARMQTRTSHPTIKNPEQGLYVLSRFAADFELPSPTEGYDRILSLNPADHTSPVYSRSEIADILRRIHDSTPVSAVSSARSHSSQSIQGRQLSRVNSHRGYVSRGYPSSRHHGMPRGRGINSTTAMSISWRAPRENAAMRGAGHAWCNTTHSRLKPEWIDPPTTAESKAQSEGEAARGSTSHGTGTANDPLIIS